MFQLSNIKNVASNVLDLVFTNETEDIKLCGAPVSISKVDETDRFHPPIEITFEYEVGEQTVSSEDTVEVNLYGKGNYERMCQQLNDENFAKIFDRMEVDEAFEYFYDKLNTLVIENIPRIRIKKYKNKPVWWTSELQKLKNKRDKIYKRKPKNESSLEYTESVVSFNELEAKLFDE